MLPSNVWEELFKIWMKQDQPQDYQLSIFF